MSLPQPMKRETLSQQLAALAESMPPGVQRSAVLAMAQRAKRQADELEVARVALHNLDMEDCARCGEWYGIGALTEDWCAECIAAAREQAYEDRQITNRIARGGWLPREVGR